jgi:hypothetical protein
MTWKCRLSETTQRGKEIDITATGASPTVGRSSRAVRRLLSCGCCISLAGLLTRFTREATRKAWEGDRLQTMNACYSRAAATSRIDRAVGGVPEVVSENGCACRDMTKEDAVNDTFRANYLKSCIAAMHRAIAQGADVRGYFAWSFLDNYEWSYGYSKRFGLVWVDYETQERVPKSSAQFLSEIIQTNALVE